MSWLKSTIVSLVIASLSHLADGQCDISPLQLTWGNTTVTRDGLGVSRGIEVGIGTPNQIFAFRPSTTLNNTRVNNALSCGSNATVAAQNDTCVGGLGGVFDLSASSSYRASIKAQWNGSEIDNESPQVAYVYFNDDVNFIQNGMVTGFPLVLDGQLDGRGAQSSLPLGTNSSFLDAAVKGGVAPSSVLGLWSGSRSVNPFDGQLVLGGYDKARVNGDFTNFSISDWGLEKACPLQVTVTDVTFAGQSLFINSTEKQMVACVEPNTQRSVFTPALALAFANITQQNRTYKGMTYPVEQRPEGDMVITINGDYNTTITNFELFNPLRGSDSYGRYAITNDSVVEAGVADTRAQDAGDVNPTLGGLFLTFNYLLVDYNNKQFRLAPAVSTDTEVNSVNIESVCTPTGSPNSGEGGTNVGAIAGGTVGGVIGAALLAGLAFFLIRRRKKEKQTEVSEAAVVGEKADEKRSMEPQMVHSDSRTGTLELPDSAENAIRAELPTNLPSMRKASRPEWLEHSEPSPGWDGQREESETPSRYM